MMEMQKPNMVAIIKAEMIWVVLIGLALLMAYKAGVYAEKLGALEDIVFDQGLYKKLEIDMEKDAR